MAAKSSTPSASGENVDGSITTDSSSSTVDSDSRNTELRSELLHMLGHHAEAFDLYKEYVHVKDSLDAANQLSKVNNVMMVIVTILMDVVLRVN